LKRLPLVALGLIISGPLVGQAAQLDPSKQDAFHQHVANLLAGVRPPAPAGDTAVSWTERGPILYFTARIAGDTVWSSMAREDGLVGSAKGTWSGSDLSSFHVVWAKGDSVVADLSGHVEGSRLILHGSRDTSLAVPTLRWAVADYGLEDQLVPLWQQIGGAEEHILVLRPYPFKWDTVTVSAQRSGSYFIVSARHGAKVRETYLLDPRGLLLLRRSDVVMERRPLEGTLRHQQYRRAIQDTGLGAH
jgi:hypothetical protein